MIWDVSPTLFSFDLSFLGISWLTSISVRYYSLMFLITFAFGFSYVKRAFIRENYPLIDLDDLLIYIMLGTVIGARLGHVLFYNPGAYFSNPISILKVWEGGLASHGGVIGIVSALYLFSKKKKGYSFFWLLDRVAIPSALGGAFVRLGNLFNSEIIGRPADIPWGIAYPKYGATIMRHPTQVYEALAYLLTFFFLHTLYKKYKEKLPSGRTFGWFLILIFSARFIIEPFKLVQEAFEKDMVFNMGQLLSVPAILLGAYFVYSSKNRALAPARPTPDKTDETKPKKKKKNK